MQVKEYKSNREGKAEFVAEVLSPLMVQARTGYYGAEYEVIEGQGEYVWLLDRDGEKCMAVNVSCDSVQAIVQDVFNKI